MEAWELKLHVYPSAGGFEKKKNKKTVPYLIAYLLTVRSEEICKRPNRKVKTKMGF